MTGATIIGELLRAEPSVTARVVAASIKGGKLPDDVVLPALLVRVISSVERQSLIRPAKVRTTDRVAVTVRAQNYRDQGEIIKLAREACAGRTGNLAGAESVSILTAGTGPDVLGPGLSFEQTIDFRVSYDA